MVGLIFLFLNLFFSLFKSKSGLEAENAALRQQLTVLQRKARGRVQFTNSDRLFFIQLYRWFPAILKAMTIIRPETLVRWHRAGFRRQGVEALPVQCSERRRCKLREVPGCDLFYSPGATISFERF